MFYSERPGISNQSHKNDEVFVATWSSYARSPNLFPVKVKERVTNHCAFLCTNTVVVPHFCLQFALLRTFTSTSTSVWMERGERSWASDSLTMVSPSINSINAAALNLLNGHATHCLRLFPLPFLTQISVFVVNSFITKVYSSPF